MIEIDNLFGVSPNAMNPCMNEHIPSRHAQFGVLAVVSLMHTMRTGAWINFALNRL